VIIHPDNPESNVLGAGIETDDLIAAISRSGYPLQSEVVDIITRELPISAYGPRVLQEEWSYIDRDENTTRQLDALLSFEVERLDESHKPALPTSPEAYLRGHLDFLIECKQSELPFVFFVRDADFGNFPILGGIPFEDIRIYMGQSDPNPMRMTTYNALSLHDLPFAITPPVAVSMSRVYRKGKSLELSGEESFRGLALPVLKALSYYLQEVTPRSPQLYQDIRTVVPLVVLRAPIVAVKMVNGGPALESVPWVRLIHNEPGRGSALDSIGRYAFSGNKAFDVVHVDYLSQYVGHSFKAACEVIKRARIFGASMMTGAATFAFDTAESRKTGSPDGMYASSLPHFDGEPNFEKWLRRTWRGLSNAPFVAQEPSI